MSNPQSSDQPERRGQLLTARVTETEYFVQEKCFRLVVSGLPPSARLSPQELELVLSADYIQKLADHLAQRQTTTQAATEWIH